MSPGTSSPSHAARKPSSAARAGTARADRAPRGDASASRGTGGAVGAPGPEAADPDGDPEISSSARDAAGETGDEPGDGTSEALRASIGALERIVIGSVGITTQALAQAAPDVELTFSQWRALLVLADPPSGYRVGEVAARVGVTLPATSRLLRRLERRGLVALAPDEADRRATRATLTAHGAEVRDAILAFRRAALRDIAVQAGTARPRLSARAIDSLAASFERYG